MSLRSTFPPLKSEPWLPRGRGWIVLCRPLSTSTSKNRVFTVNHERNFENSSQGHGRQEGVRRRRSRHLQHSLVRQLFSSLFRRFFSPDPGHCGRGGEEAKGLRDSSLSYRGLPEWGVGIDGL